MSSGEVVQPDESLVPVLAQQQLATADFFQEPKLVLERAEKVSKALKKFLDRKKKKVEFNGERYPQAEDWQFVAAFFGHTARVRSTMELRHEEDGYVTGYLAAADVLNSSGQVVSAAEAACMRAEYNWGTKPDFQLRSMAQTRACAKALRNVFAWVMIMAGLAPTPAEELPEGNGDTNGSPASKRRHSQSSKPPNGRISSDQQKRLFTIAGKKGMPHEEIRKLIGSHGFEHSHEITQEAYGKIMCEIEGGNL